MSSFAEIEVKIISSINEVQIEAFSSKSKKRLHEFGEKFDVKKLFTDYHDLLKDEKIDLVFITSSSRDHYHQSIDALKNFKNLFLEKPPALNFNDALKIYKLAVDSKLFVKVGYIYRFETRLNILRNIISNKKQFGNIVYMVFKFNNSCRSLFKDSSHDLVYEAMCHDLDIALWLTGSRVKSVYAKGYYESNKPAAILSIINFKNGVVAFFESSSIMPEGQSSISMDDNTSMKHLLEVCGTKMSSEIDFFNSGFKIVSNEKTIKPDTFFWPEIYFQNGNGALRREIEYFIDKVKEKNAVDPAELFESIYSIKVADAIIESIKTSKEILID